MQFSFLPKRRKKKPSREKFHSSCQTDLKTGLWHEELVNLTVSTMQSQKHFFPCGLVMLREVSEETFGVSYDKIDRRSPHGSRGRVHYRKRWWTSKGHRLDFAGRMTWQERKPVEEEVYEATRGVGDQVDGAPFPLLNKEQGNVRLDLRRKVWQESLPTVVGIWQIIKVFVNGYVDPES